MCLKLLIYIKIKAELTKIKLTVLRSPIWDYSVLLEEFHRKMEYNGTPLKSIILGEFICPFFFFFFFFLIQFSSLSSFFTHIETNQSVGGAKTGVPGEIPPDTPASRTWLVSHMNSCPVPGANPHRRDDRMIKSTEVSDLNHSAMGAACPVFCLNYNIN